jgi:hypothetical protein
MPILTFAIRYLKNSVLFPVTVDFLEIDWRGAFSL